MEERGEGDFNDGTEPAGKNYLGDGTLTPASGETPLYWPDNVNEYGFKVVSNNGTLKKDQRDPATLTGAESELEASSGYNFWSNDHLEGYGYIPGRFDVLNNYNFRTTNKWYTHNQMVWKGANATSNVAMPTDPDIFKRVPLYMLHKRAWITVILKAGTGVTRRSLHYAETGGNSLSRSVIYSKKKTQKVLMKYILGDSLLLLRIVRIKMEMPAQKVLRLFMLSLNLIIIVKMNC